MPEKITKMQQRAALISILNKYQDREVSSLELSEDIEKLKNFSDASYICKTLFREIKDLKSNYTNICAIMAIEAIEDEIFEKQAISYLKDENNSDEKKLFIISLLRQKGIPFDYQELSSYIKNPQLIAQNGVKEFLDNAIEDPEVQIDLLDFYMHISEDEKISLLENLLDEYDGDNLACALTIISQLDISQSELKVIIEGLVKSSSPFALEGLNHILNNCTIDDIEKHNIEKAIKQINFKNPNFKNDAIIKDSVVYKSFIGFVDGRNDFSGIIARKHRNSSIDAILLTMNINTGIKSCMGFGNITAQNLNSIIKRLYTDSMPVAINPSSLKALYLHYLKKSKQNKIQLPYELIVWKKLLEDIEDIKEDTSDHINKNLKKSKLTQQKVLKFCSSKMLETWYYSYRQNPSVDEIISEMEEKRTVNQNEIDEIVSKIVERDFINNPNFREELTNKLLILAYVANLAGLGASSSCAYSLCFDNPYIKMIITSSVDKSIYYYLSSRLYECEDENLFTERNKIKTNYNEEQLKQIMAQLEEKWNQKDG